MRIPKHLLLVALLSCLHLQSAWIDRKAEGWAWYQDTEKLKKTDEEQDSKQAVASPTEQLDKLKRELETYLAQAVLEPTDENIRIYMEAQKEWLMRSGQFSKTWAKVLLTHPELDPTATTFATTQYGRLLQQRLEQQQKEKLIRDYAQSHALLFFYEGTKEESKAFSGVVLALSKKYEWAIQGVSVDGVILEEVSNSRSDNNLSQKFEIRIFPALLALAIGLTSSKRQPKPLIFPGSRSHVSCVFLLGAAIPPSLIAT